MFSMKYWKPQDISAFRSWLELSRQSFGELLGVSRIHIYYIEKGVKEPSKTLKLLLNYVEKEKRKEGKKKHGKRHLQTR
jgi:DNA-binding transcriptional regulator YiaG